MKKVLLLFLVVGCLFCTACSEAADKKPQPERALGQSVTSGMFLEFRYSYAEAVKEADLVVEVEIVEYKGELPDDIYTWGSLYRAKILNTYKNDIDQGLTEIDLIQDGDSEVTWQGFPLFQTGDRLILTLVESDFVPGSYRILGEEQTALKVVSTAEGDICYTFLPIMNDLPKEGVTEEMKRAAQSDLDQKYIIPQGESEPAGLSRPANNYTLKRNLELWLEGVV